MNKIYLIALLILFALSNISGKEYIGKVIQENGSPIFKATIKVRAISDLNSIIADARSNENGDFVVDIPSEFSNNRITLIVSQYGYYEYSKRRLLNTTYLGNVELKKKIISYNDDARSNPKTNNKINELRAQIDTLNQKKELFLQLYLKEQKQKNIIIEKLKLLDEEVDLLNDENVYLTNKLDSIQRIVDEKNGILEYLTSMNLDTELINKATDKIILLNFDVDLYSNKDFGADSVKIVTKFEMISPPGFLDELSDYNNLEFCIRLINISNRLSKIESIDDFPITYCFDIANKENLNDVKLSEIYKLNTKSIFNKNDNIIAVLSIVKPDIERTAFTLRKFDSTKCRTLRLK